MTPSPDSPAAWGVRYCTKPQAAVDLTQITSARCSFDKARAKQRCGKHTGSQISGVVAQLGERVVRNDEVRSSILLGSTNFCQAR